MSVKLINILETIITKRDFYYRLMGYHYKDGDIIKQFNTKRNFDNWPHVKKEAERLLEKYKPRNYPSRYTCNFIFDELDDAIKFEKLTSSYSRQMYKIKIFPKSVIVKLDSVIVSEIIENLSMKNINEVKILIKDYWDGKPSKKETPLWETLFNGDMQIIERVNNA